jgi:hypothetical protein
MPSPSGSLATLRPDLAGSFMEFDLEMDRRGFIGQRVLPVLEVPKASGTFGIIPIEQLLQNRETARAPGSGYSRGQFTFDDVSFSCSEHGAEEPVDDRESALYSNYFDAEQVAAMRAYDVVLRNQEKRVASLLFNSTTYTGASLTTAVSTEWSTAATATPISDVEAAVRKVYTNTGLWANALIISKIVFRNLRLCASVKDAIAASGAGMPTRAQDITTAMLAAVFDLDYILVGGSTKNTAGEGQTATPDQIWDDEYAMVCRIATSNDIKEPCIGRTFHWGEDGSNIGGTVETYRDESVRSDIVRVRHDVQEKILYTEMGHLLSNITA